ncbi:MAG: hypothetical protein ACUVQ2_08555 [Dissulfurimicrobium sp.]|uniref:hypothetical protein n=1 Tax=Dissulfurimicrobium sp. TaxID=2022436 RepID=UPI00404AAB5A
MKFGLNEPTAGQAVLEMGTVEALYRIRIAGPVAVICATPVSTDEPGEQKHQCHADKINIELQESPIWSGGRP